MATRASEPPTLMRRTPMLGKIFDGKAERAAVEKIDRLRRHRLHGRLDLLAGLDAGRVEAIGAGIGECLQAADGLVEVRPVA